MSIKRTPIPSAREHASMSLFMSVTTPEERRRIQAEAPAQFHLWNDREADGAWTAKQVAALAQAANKRGYRVQSRALGDSKQRRHVWVSWEPGRYQKKETGQ